MTRLQRLKATGRRGDWFASVNSESLPCVHQHWSHKGHYHDPHVEPGTYPWPAFLHAIASGKRVILTSDNVTLGAHGIPYGFERTGYIALFTIEDIEIGASDLKFRFAQRLADLE